MRSNRVLSWGFVLLMGVSSAYAEGQSSSDLYLVRSSSRSSKGETWLKAQNRLENYQAILKQFKTRLDTDPALTSWSELPESERLLFQRHIQLLSTQYTPADIERLMGRGVDVFTYLVIRGKAPGDIWKAFLGPETVVRGRVVAGENRPRSDGWASVAVVVVSEVLKGKVSVGDTIHVRQFTGPRAGGLSQTKAHGEYLKYLGGGKYSVKDEGSDVIFGLYQVGYPLLFPDLPQLPGKLPANEYFPYIYFRVLQDGTLSGARPQFLGRPTTIESFRKIHSQVFTTQGSK